MAPALAPTGSQSPPFVSSHYLSDYGSLKYRKIECFTVSSCKLSPSEYNEDILQGYC